MNVCLKISDYRHIAIAFMFVWLKHFVPGSEDDQGHQHFEIPAGAVRRPGINQQTGSSLLLDLQAGHTERVAGKVYAFSSNDFAYISKDNLQNFYLCSLEWHQLLRKYLFDL